MTLFFQGRSLRYEIQALIDTRWCIMSVADDERETLGREFDVHDLRAVEARVQDLAKQILRKPEVSSIRIFRERRRGDQWSSAEQIYQEAKPPVKKGPRFRDYSGDAVLCASPEDLLRRPARRMIGVMLRPLLDELSLTPLELLTIDGASKTVERASETLVAAMMRAAQLQSLQNGGDTRARMSVLETIVWSLRKQIKGAEASAADLSDTSLFFEFRRLCLALRAASGSGKIDTLLDMASGTDDPQKLRPIDGFLADLFDHPLTLQDMLGHQPSLHAALRSLTAIAGGAAAGNDPILAKLAAAIKRGVLPETAESLFDRILHSLNGTVALTHGDLSAEWQAVDQVQAELLPKFPEKLRKSGLIAVTKRRDALQGRALELAQAVS